MIGNELAVGVDLSGKVAIQTLMSKVVIQWSSCIYELDYLRRLIPLLLPLLELHGYSPVKLLICRDFELNLCKLSSKKLNLTFEMSFDAHECVNTANLHCSLDLKTSFKVIVLICKSHDLLLEVVHVH